MKHIIFAVTIFTFISYALFLVYQQEQILEEGHTVVLKTAPVDPRDMFRGEYVILRYEIEEEAYDEMSYYEPEDGSSAYVLLYKDSRGVGQVSRVYDYDDRLNPSDVYIKGEVKNGRVRFADLEQYYVPEGLGLKIEAMPRGSLYVEVRIKGGQARIVQLLDENLEPLELSL